MRRIDSFHIGTQLGQCQIQRHCPSCPSETLVMGHYKLLVFIGMSQLSQKTHVFGEIIQDIGYIINIGRGACYLEIEKYLGHVGQLGQVVEVHRNKVTQMEKLSGTSLGLTGTKRCKTGRVSRDGEKGCHTKVPLPPPVVSYFKGSSFPRFSYSLRALSNRILIASDLVFTRLPNRKSSSLSISSLSATKIILGFSVGMGLYYHMGKVIAKRDVDNIKAEGIMGINPTYPQIL